jgi:hypothetical protein
VVAHPEQSPGAPKPTALRPVRSPHPALGLVEVGEQLLRCVQALGGPLDLPLEDRIPKPDPVNGRAVRTRDRRARAVVLAGLDRDPGRQITMPVSGRLPERWRARLGP